MKIKSIFSGLALLVSLTLGVEGADWASDGSIYLASLYNLAQTESQAQPLAEPVKPMEPAPQEMPQSQPPQQQPQQPSQQQPVQEFKELEEPVDFFVDPREIQQVQQEIKNLNSQVKRLLSQSKKLANFESDRARLNEILTELAGFQSALANTADQYELRDVIDEFRQANYWDEVNLVRAKIELPREIKNITSSIKRLEKMTKVKILLKLGLNMEGVRQAVSEMKEALQAVQGLYQSSDLEGAMEEMRFFYEGGHPGEIESVMNRVNNFNRMLSQVRDANVKAQAKQILQEAINTFNAGEYREAQEILNGGERIIQQSMTGNRKPVSK